MEQENRPVNSETKQDLEEGTFIKLKQNENIEIKLPLLRESVLPSVFPLSCVVVHFPTANASFLKKIMVYKIDFSWNGIQKSVVRRFSEIENFRTALQWLLPYTFIFPVHRKQLGVELSDFSKRPFFG